MNNKFIDTLTFDKLSSIIMSCTNRIIFSSTNLHEEIGVALYEASKKGIDVTLIIDPSEENYRNGLGDIRAINLLEKVPVRIFEVPGNQISFIIADESGYIFSHKVKFLLMSQKDQMLF